MPRIEPAPGKGVLLARVLGRAPAIRDAVVRLDEVLRLEGRLDRTLKEHVRRETAARIGCRYCASLGEPVREPEDRREALALALARQMAEDPAAVTHELFGELQDEFDDEELVELVAWTAYVVIGGQVFGATMALEPADGAEASWYQRTIVQG